MVVHLDELPGDPPVGWFGRPWDAGCLPENRIDVPEGEICAYPECYGTIGARSSGVVTKNADDDWQYFHADCWGAAMEEARQAIHDVLGGGNDW